MTIYLQTLDTCKIITNTIYIIATQQIFRWSEVQSDDFIRMLFTIRIEISTLSEIHSGYTEVTYKHILVFINKNIQRFQISMHETQFVDVVHSKQKLLENLFIIDFIILFNVFIKIIRIKWQNNINTSIFKDYFLQRNYVILPLQRAEGSYFPITKYATIT
ncbi:unnamed protein product [Paramecium octaurelia]|uniref:Uncharacterized protein n=1 Tax=Paramecium octaurelia TaxID=43137 RepID=A0A8S1TGB2_PAROT|nr:unnamed protein product [Paramecium octaurelia]